MRRALIPIAGAALLLAVTAYRSSTTGVVTSPVQPPAPTTTDVIEVVAQPGSERPGDPGGETGGTIPIPCAWVPDPASPDEAEQLNDITEWIYGIINEVLDTDLVITFVFYSEDGTLHAWDDVQGRFEMAQIADCSRATVTNGVTTGDRRWVAVTPPSPTILVPPAVARAIEPIQPPAPAINPPDRTAVNLGMWLAVDDAGPFSVRADLGPLWAEVTASLTSTTFHLGGDRPSVTCPGNGTPIPDTEREHPDEGPCGHTFRSVDDIGPTRISILSTWTVSWVTSDGRSGTRPSLLTGTTVDYEAYEIQTVGVDG